MPEQKHNSRKRHHAAEKKSADYEILIESEQEQTRKAAAQIIEPQAPESDSDIEEETGLPEKLSAFFAEINLGVRHIGYGVGCLAFVAIIYYGISFGLDFFEKRDAGEEAKEVTDEIAEPQEVIETGVSSAQFFAKPGETVLRQIGATGISAGVVIGGDEDTESKIARYIVAFRRMQNAFDVDLDRLLNNSRDRRATLRAHLSLLKKLFAEGEIISAEIGALNEEIRSEYATGQETLQALDEQFFADTQALQGEAAQRGLTDFIIQHQKQVALRARFQGLSEVRAFYASGLPKVEKVIQAIELNEEALVQGLKFYDVAGVDLNLLQPVPGERESASAPAGRSVEQRSSLTSPPGSFRAPAPGGGLPINPFNVKTDRDFVTYPGTGLPPGVRP